jgi:transposase
MENRLQVGVDVGKNQLDLAVLAPSGQVLTKHRRFPNSLTGYAHLRDWLITTLQAQALAGLDVAAEATSYYWLPLFSQLAQDRLLTEFQPRLLLLNPSWVKWFKKGLSPVDKSDQADPYYIAERLRSLPGKTWWQWDPHWLTLRVLTRLHHHLAHSLTREKNHYQLFLFVAHSAYAQTPPFSDPFGVTSQTLLSQPDLLVELGRLPLPDLAQRLSEVSHHHLPDPLQTAARLQQALQTSYPLPLDLEPPVQFALQSLAEVIAGLQTQLAQLDASIQQCVSSDYPEVGWLQSIRGIGLILAASLAAEIGGIQRFCTPPHWDTQQQVERARTLREVEDAVAKFAGLWWPRAASGDFEAEDRRLSKRGNAYLRYALIEAADHLRQTIPSYTRYYARKYDEVHKHRHQRALVLTARKAVGLMVGLLHRQEAYRPEEDALHPA